MGTTIRRQPVTFDMPAAPNYKFLNITNFRGLDVSSNPFELSPNTASDCLNVYVDEANTLTTRPRLEKKFDTFVGKICIGAYSLHDGYLFHLLDTDEYILRLVKNNEIKNVYGEDIPTGKIRVFEHGDLIYVISDSGYFEITFDNETSNYIFQPVSSYIPIRYVNDVPNEPLNALTPKYIKQMAWDGTSVLSEKSVDYLMAFDRETVDNAIYQNYLNGAHIIQVYPDGAFWFYVKKQVEADQNIIAIRFAYKNSSGKYVVTQFGDYSMPWSMSSSTNIYEYFYPLCASYNKYTLYVGRADNQIETIEYVPSPDGDMFGGGVIHTSEYTMKDLKISANDKYLTIIPHSGQVRLIDLITQQDAMPALRDIVKSVSEFSDKTISIIYDVACAPDGTNMYITFNYYVDAWSLGVVYAEDGLTFTTFAKKIISQREYKSYVSPDKLHFYSVGKFDQDPTMQVISTSDKNKQLITKLYKDPIENLYVGENHFAYKTVKNESNQSILTVIDVDTQEDLYSIRDISQLSTTDLNPIFYLPKKYLVAGIQPADELDVYRWKDDQFNIRVELEILETDEDYAKWTSLYDTIRSAKLYTRFDNNYWFASGNRYYRSANNDPTYFPITEYNDLGDSNEEITGFNLANDTTLIAYKKNRLYLIQPFTSSLDTTEYTITESKNTVGNTAIGAPIVTTLTEIPLQINNDGVYGLSQVSNVSATERIADLMSEPINERWLDIPDNFITNAKTLNRLYWTYIIIPREDLSKTIVYLLDNRTNSWYYWEFPIIVTDAFIKDNVTEFVDKFGAIYRLTSTDIVNKSFTTQLVTEYYDDGRLVIPWYWQSQVMYLGTMNYSKRLVNTTFILTDTDSQDGYGLNYNFKVFRKLASSTPEKELSGDLTLVRSTTKKTNISKFGFVQLKLSNITEESQGTEPEKAFRNNKLRLVGLGLKYVLLEGLIR